MNGIAARRDERETSIDQAADRLAYLALSYGLLGLVIWRSFVDRVAAWDLLALVVAGGMVGSLYRVRMGVISPGWLRAAALTAIVALVIAVVIALVARG